MAENPKNETQKTVIASQHDPSAQQPPVRTATDPAAETVTHADPDDKTVVTKRPDLDQTSEQTVRTVIHNGKSDSAQTMETVIQANLTEGNLADQTMETVIQEGFGDEEALADQTMETVMGAGSTQIQDKGTQETVMLDSGIVRGSSKEGSPKTAGPAGSERKYKVIKSLGKGGFAWVYLVLNQDLNRKEAMKILNSELTSDEDVLERFVKEARISANFNHQNIVMVYEVQKRGTWDMIDADPQIKQRHREPFAFFTMSFVEGHTATELIHKTGRIKQKMAVSIAIDACAALEYAHAKGVVHRDIKPDNILVDHKGNGIVMDFGIAKAADATRQTAAGTFMGTARYVSPEQAMGKEIDGRSDIYSLGVALYELTTGTVPFDSDQWMTVLYQHINEPPPAPEKYYEGIDRDLRATILTMLEKKREDRFQTASEAHQALCNVYQKMGGRDRKTEAMDHIATRRDIEGRGQTQATEHVLNKPPVRTAKHETPARRPPAKPKGKLLVGALVLILLVIFGITYFWPTPPILPVKTSTLFVSAFPRGELIKISNEEGEIFLNESVTLPHRLDLPVGTYQLTVSYKNAPKHIPAIVLQNKVTKAHVTFDVDLEMFLIEEDLK